MGLFKDAGDRPIPAPNPIPGHCYDGRVIESPPAALRRPLHTVFLDRDGILNEKAAEGEYVTRWEQFRVLPGVPQAVARLNRAGLLVIVVSNQRGIARGMYTAPDVDIMHSRFQEILKAHGAHLDAFFVCPHEEGQCNCRKPLPGMFEMAARQFPEISASSSVMIGDSAADMEFGARLGMTTILIEGDPARHKPKAAAAGAFADLHSKSLPEAVDILIAAR